MSDASTRLETCQLPRPIIIHVDDIEPNPAGYLGVDGSGEAPSPLTEHELLVPVLVAPGVQRTYRIVSGERQWRTFVARRNLGFIQYEYIQARDISSPNNQLSEPPALSGTLLEWMPPSVHQAGRDALEELRPLVGGTYKYRPPSPTTPEAGETRSARTVVVRATLRQLNALIKHTNIADVEVGPVAALELGLVELKQLLIQHGVDLPRNDGDLSATLIKWLNDFPQQVHDR